MSTSPLDLPESASTPGSTSSSTDAPPFSDRLADALGGPILRGVRNVVRSPLRLALVAAILGISLMLVGVMVALNASVQQRVSAAQAQIGTGITISPADAGQGGFGGGSGTAYLTSSQITTVEKTAGVASLSEYLSTRDTDGVIKGAIKIPTNLPTFGGGNGANGGTGGGNGGTGRGGFFGGGVDGTIAPTIQGLLPGQSPLTLDNGVGVTIKSGRNLAAADANANVALTSQALATANGYKLGSTLTLKNVQVTLVGLYTASNTFDNNTIVVPLQTAQRIYGITGVTGLTAYASSVGQVSTVTSALQKSLGSSVNVVSQAQLATDAINALQTTLTTIHTTLWIAIAVAALIIVFAVFLIVRERTREIGLLRAIGASRLQIVGQFAMETLTLGVAAAVAATVLIALFAGTIARQFLSNTAGAARTGGRIFTRGAGGFTPPAGGFGGGGGFGGSLGSAANQTLSAGLTPTTVLLVFALGTGLAILASVIPVWYVSRVRPAEALRAEG